jgi:hypothetical protein
VVQEKEAEVAIINAQREASVATIVAQKEANVSLINLEMTIKMKQAEQKRQAIDDEIYVAKQKGTTPLSTPHRSPRPPC